MLLDEFDTRRAREEGKSPWQLILWWEKRRILYNLIMWPLGILSLLAAGIVQDFMDDLFSLVLVFVGAAGNLCYTLGWIFEMSLRGHFKNPQYRFPKLSIILFWFGTVFSIAVVIGLALLAASIFDTVF